MTPFFFSLIHTSAKRPDKRSVDTTLTSNSEQVPTIYAYSSNPTGSGATLKYKETEASKLGIDKAIINKESNVLVITE